jgi:hypothetical protein
MAMMKIYLNENAYNELLERIEDYASIEREMAIEHLIEEGVPQEEVYDLPSEALGVGLAEFQRYLESLPGGNQVYEVGDYLEEWVPEVLREECECVEGKDWYRVDEVTEAVTKDK